MYKKIKHMSVAIKLPQHLVLEAKKYAMLYKRSVPKQIEYWSNIGKIVEENPDLSFNFIKDIFLSLQEAKEGEVEEYKFDKK